MALSTLKRKIAIVTILKELNEIESDDGEPKSKRGPDREWIRERERKGAFVNIFNELYVSDHEGFRRFMRMDQKQFNELTDLISAEIEKQYNKMRKPISPKERLALTLRYLATGETFRSLEYQFRISRKTICYIVLGVCDTIYKIMGKDYLRSPSSRMEWMEIERHFATTWNFPHCVRAVDGKHITIQSCGMGSQYYIYKGTHSIILMIVAGGNYEVVWADAGVNGRVSDDAVLKRSSLGHKLENNELDLPPPKPLPSRSQNVLYVLIGDDAFA